MEPTTNVTQRATPQQGFSFGDFMSFKKMITLSIMQIVYGVGAVLITFGALALMFNGGGGRGYGYGYNSLMPGGFLTGLLVLVIGNILWRVWCELIIVFFRINATLNDIDKNTSHQQ
ncbi:MAG: DUF4282 domain-containing protein [Chitinophagaceae bacterium]